MSERTVSIDNPFFSRVWTLMSSHETEALTRLRQENLAGLSGRVLEIGAGTGTNFAHYPDSVAAVVAVEPEQRLLVHARTAAEQAPVPVRVSGLAAEEIDDAGIGTEPFDAVVCSLVLCTVDDPESIVQECFSRLKPGGELRYMEHVRSGGWRGRIQRVADATVWPTLFGNCHTHRDTEDTIRRAGFVTVSSRRQWTMPRWLPLPVAEFALGRAVKPTAG
jgi:SAM-dependent methyltransferase